MNWLTYLKPDELARVTEIDVTRRALTKERTTIRNRAKNRRWKATGGK